MARLPGAELVERGLRDLKSGCSSLEALVVSVAPERLRAQGLLVSMPVEDPELKLYERLRRGARDGDDPYARYNALLRELDSFLDALEAQARRRNQLDTPS